MGAGGRAAPLHWSARLVGIAGSLLVHALLFQAGTLGSVAGKRRAPQETGPGASAVVSESTPSLTLMFIHLPGISEPNSLESLASVGITDANAAIQIASANPELAIDESLVDVDAEEVMTSGDPAARSQLFGQYTGQLAARIERAWVKPRSALEFMHEHAPDNDEGTARRQPNVFRCAVRITQDPRGHIEEIELTQCNGSPVWQQSLVNAIQRASPLPTPSNPAVFSSVLMMSFEAPEYRSGMSERGYELPPRQSAGAVMLSVDDSYETVIDVPDELPRYSVGSTGS